MRISSSTKPAFRSASASSASLTAKRPDALGPEQLGHLGDAGAPGVSREDAVDGRPSGTALHHPDVLLYGRLLNDQHPHGTAPFFSLLGRREIRLPPV